MVSRLDFIKNLGLAPLALALPTPIPTSSANYGPRDRPEYGYGEVYVYHVDANTRAVHTVPMWAVKKAEAEIIKTLKHYKQIVKDYEFEVHIIRFEDKMVTRCEVIAKERINTLERSEEFAKISEDRYLRYQAFFKEHNDR